MPREEWTEKQERKYEHIKQSQKEQGSSANRAEDIAARTIQKERARRGQTKTASKASLEDMPSSKRGGQRSGTSRPKGRTKRQLYEEAKQRGIDGRSQMTKDQLSARWRERRVKNLGTSIRRAQGGWPFGRADLVGNRRAGFPGVNRRLPLGRDGMNDRQLKRTPESKTGMLIRKPVADVFQAFIDPNITTKFWFTKGSGRLEIDKEVQWDWEMYDISIGVTAKVIEVNKRIEIEWPGYSGPTTVEWEFAAQEDGTTFVSITETGFTGDPNELMKQVADSTQGFTLVLAGLKALVLSVS